MRKYIPLVAIIMSIIIFSCSSYSNDLERMGAAVKQHFKYKDIDDGTITKISYIKAVSYEEIPEEKREDPKEVYLCKVYMRGSWSYYNSGRIFNIDDTLNCFFDKSKTFIRIGKTEEK